MGLKAMRPVAHNVAWTRVPETVQFNQFIAALDKFTYQATVADLLVAALLLSLPLPDWRFELSDIKLIAVDLL